MTLWERTKNWFKRHKTGVKATLIGVGSFAGGLLVMHKIDCMTVDKALEMLPGEIDKELAKVYDGDGDTRFLVTEEDCLAFDEEQEELRGKYGNDFAILENAVDNLTTPVDGKLWMIENGRVALIDGINTDAEPYPKEP